MCQQTKIPICLITRERIMRGRARHLQSLVTLRNRGVTYVIALMTAIAAWQNWIEKHSKSYSQQP